MDRRQQRNNIWQSAVVSPGRWAKWASWRDLTSRVLPGNKHCERKRHLVLGFCFLLRWHYSSLGGRRQQVDACHCNWVSLQYQVGQIKGGMQSEIFFVMFTEQVKSRLISKRNVLWLLEPNGKELLLPIVIPSVYIRYTGFEFFFILFQTQKDFEMSSHVFSGSTYFLRNSWVVLLSSVLLSACQMIATIRTYILDNIDFCPNLTNRKKKKVMFLCCFNCCCCHGCTRAD